MTSPVSSVGWLALVAWKDDAELAADLVHRGERGGGFCERVHCRLDAACVDDACGFGRGEVQSVSVRARRLVVAQDRSVGAGHGEGAWLEELARDRYRRRVTGDHRDGRGVAQDRGVQAGLAAAGIHEDRGYLTVEVRIRQLTTGQDGLGRAERI